MTEFQPMSPSERQIMRVLWANPNSTSGYIIEQLQRSFSWSDLNYSLIQKRIYSN